MDLTKELPTCIICFQVFKDPLIDSCGHTFCQDCATRWMSSGQKCPISKKYLANKLHPNLSVKSFLSKNFSICGNSTNGCSWIGKVKALPKYHQPNCPFVNFDCSVITSLRENNLESFLKVSEVIREDGSAFKGILRQDGSFNIGVLKFSDGTSYEGQFENNEFSGLGKLSINETAVYEGQFKGNKKHGFGTVYVKSSPVLEGWFVDDLFQGNGVLYMDNKNWKGEFAFDGQFSNGTIKLHNGTTVVGEFEQFQLTQGTLTSPDGKILTCQFKDLIPNGKGVELIPNEQVYEGDFVNGLFDGDGELTNLKTQSRYVGAFKKGKKEGLGTAFINNVKVAEGTFKNGYLEGPNIKLFMPDASTVTAKFINGVIQDPITQNFANGEIFNGSIKRRYVPNYEISLNDVAQINSILSNLVGTLTYPNGDKYQGTLRNGQRIGTGKFFFANKEVFEGTYKGDLADGPGTLTLIGGYVLKGTWKDDKLEDESIVTFNRKLFTKQTWLNGDLVSNQKVSKDEQLVLTPAPEKPKPKSQKIIKPVIR